MCDNKNELHKSEKDKSKRNTSTRLELDITDTTDTYPEFDFLDLLRNLQVENKKSKNKITNEESGNKSISFSDDDSDPELLARFYDEKYGKDYEFDADGYDEDDSFIDNSDAVIDLIPNGIQTEFGGFYINRGKLSFIREENSSSSVSEDVDKFLAQKKLVIKKVGHHEETDEKRKESSKNAVNNSLSSNHVSNKSSNNNNNNNNNNNDNINITNVNTENSSTGNTENANVNNFSNNSCNIGNGTIKNRKRSGEFNHKSKKNRKTATPKIPDHLIHRKPFSGSSEFRKNINEIKKNKMKNVEAERKIVSSDIVISESATSTSTNTTTTTTSSINVTATATTTVTTLTSNNKNSNNCNTINNIKSNTNDSEVIYTNTGSSVTNHNNNINNNIISDHHNYVSTKKEIFVKKKATTVKEILKDRDAASEVIEAVATGADLSSKSNYEESSSDSESSESSNSDSSSESSDDKYSEKRKVLSRPSGETVDSHRKVSLNGVFKEDFTAKNFAHLNDGLKGLIDKIVETSKEEKNKLSNSKLNGLLLRIDGRLRELPASERNAVLDYLASVLQLKKESIIKKTKKLHFVQEEAKMTFPLRRLKEIVTEMMPALESNYLKEFTKATGTSGVEHVTLPQKKFPWNEEIRYHLREVVKLRENCYHIVRPRKESISEYVRSFLESKIKPLWPKDWMTVDILWEEGKSSNTGSNEEKPKVLNKPYPVQNSPNSNQKKGLGSFQNLVTGNKKSVLQPVTHTESSKSNPNINKIPEVKSILIPRKVPQNIGNAQKSNYQTSGSTVQSSNTANRFPVAATKGGSDFLDKMSSQSNVLNRNPSQQISNNKPQQQSSPNRVIKPVSCSVGQNQIRPNIMRTASPNSGSSKSILYRNCSGSQQNVYKTIEIHSKPVSGSKGVGNSVTISPVTESMLKDISSSPEILNLTKNPSVCISKITDCADKQFNRSNSPSVNRSLPSGITISPTNALTSSFLSKQKKPVEKASESRINVTVTKQEANPSVTKDKRKSVLNVNMKRGPLQNIPDCISVTSNLMSQERYNKVEHVRKRAVQEYHEQQAHPQQQIHQQQRQSEDSPERLKLEEKRIKLEDNFLNEIEIKEEKLDDQSFSKIFDSVMAKTAETVMHGDDSDCQSTSDRFSGMDGDSFFNSNTLTTYCSSGLGHYKNKSPKLREIRVGKEKPYLLVKGENSTSHIFDEKRLDECDEHSDNVKELQVQQEMDRVMQNLVELSNQRIKDQEYEIESHHSPTTAPAAAATATTATATTATPTSRSQSSFQVYPKISYK